MRNHPDICICDPINAGSWITSGGNGQDVSYCVEHFANLAPNDDEKLRIDPHVVVVAGDQFAGPKVLQHHDLRPQLNKQGSAADKSQSA